MNRKLLLTCLLFSATLQSVDAQTRYVTDEFEIMLRTGESGRHEILRQLRSGTPVTVVEPGANYTKVRLSSGTEGYVLSRYLTNQPAARDRIATYQKKYDELKAEFDQKVEQEKVSLNNEISRLKRIAKKPLELQKENAELKAKLEEEKSAYLALQAESEVLKSPHKDRQWFITGALVVVSSMILGILLTRISWQKRKKWNQL